MRTLNHILKTKKNFVVLGETGSGKSEIVLNIAVMLAEQKEKEVHLFDMDQTKPLFRSRDMKEKMEEKGVIVHYQHQVLDTPVLVSGVIPRLLDDNCLVLLDVGGGENAARMVGCFSEYFKGSNSEALYIVNPFRPWSRELKAMDVTLGTILQSCNIEKFSLLANPNLGHTTTAEDYLEGNKRLKNMLGSRVNVVGSCIKEDLYHEIKDKSEYDVYPIHLYLTYPWIHEAI